MEKMIKKYWLEMKVLEVNEELSLGENDIIAYTEQRQEILILYILRF